MLRGLSERVYAENLYTFRVLTLILVGMLRQYAKSICEDDIFT
jgi:hypothetical protein